MRPARLTTIRPRIDHAAAVRAQALLIEESGESFSVAETVEHLLRRYIRSKGDPK